ncbi:MAG TPA: PHB depolymerase family esterase [Mycobacteriales bacterium]|jgi:poly(hydroxyalkanoate) depolymerase family esterase|nr:PHB depolymerase family esterase [Mycobacteriales bacterium]
MSPLRRLLAAAALLSAVLASGASASGASDGAAPSCARLQPASWTGTFTPGTFTADGLSRGYCLYLPAGGVQAGRPLVVYLHGCNETAEQTAQASHFNDIADRDNLVVLYPQQNVTTNSSAPFADGNGVGCWNWFLPEDQHRGAGEPAVLADLTQSVVASQQIDPARVFVTGVSAGADMATILAADYPDVYAAAAPIAGCAFQTCTDAAGALAYQVMGPRARVVPMLVENGTADSLNNMTMATGLVHGWLGTDDLADDGAANASISRTPASTTTYDADQTPQPGSGDLCIHNNTFTCPGGAVGFQGSYPYTVQTYDDAAGHDVLEFWVIHGMEHAHPDAPGDGPYTDPLGPDISLASYCFFAAHPMTGAPVTPEGCPAT